MHEKIEFRKNDEHSKWRTGQNSTISGWRTFVKQKNIGVHRQECMRVTNGAKAAEHRESCVCGIAVYTPQKEHKRNEVYVWMYTTSCAKCNTNENEKERATKLAIKMLTVLSLR